LGAITVALLFLIIAPITTVSITLDMPPPHAVSRQILAPGAGAIWIIEALVATPILGVAGWIAWRIVRRYRNSN
jgi:hypothetical protein